jgi:PAS domain S-box-containing protein
VVDDNAAKRLALRAVLTPLGYTIVEADSGQTALRCVMAQDFAVILLDVCMPTMDGIETAALIRQRRQSEMTPIIFITAHSSDEIENKDGYAQGAVDFIFAPVPPDELRAKVCVFANLFTRAEGLATQVRAVQTTADELRLLTDAAPIGIFQTNAENKYVYTNPRWSEITGITPAEAAGRAWDIVIDTEQHADFVAKFTDGTSDQRELCHRFEIRPHDSDPRIVLVTSTSIPDNEGGITGWVGTLADVTAEAGAEAALSDARDKAMEASRLKSNFLANMSHEIRTPMNGVIGMADLLLETDLDARQRDFGQTLRNSGEALLTIINDILDFSKIEAGKLEVEDLEFSVQNVVDDVVNLLAGPAQAKDLELMAVVESSVPPVVSGDPGRVRQVLINLIGNAVKFTPTGEIVVRVTGSDTGDAGVAAASGGVRGDETVVRFEVSDTGDGIASDKLDSIFEPFVQADSSTTRKYGGTGLGLAISSQLVALMGGDCGVSSQQGTGSTFWFTIRVDTDAAAATHEQSHDTDLAGLNALVVDDNATHRGILTEYLTEWGMTVATADSGPAGLARLRTALTENRPFTVALVDGSLPGMGGSELIDAIVVDPARDTRLVIMTERGHDADAGDVAQSVVCTSLPKPIHRENLRTCLRVALDLRVPDVVATAVKAPSSTADPAPAGDADVGRVLLAEDNIINQKVAVAMLSSAGYRVDTVLNGAAAVQAVAAQPYDAVLMDCQMPELNGYEATAAIRALKSPGRLTPIIAMTAGARREDRERCLAVGMDSYLAKPVSKDALLTQVARAVHNETSTHSPVAPVGPRPAPEVTVDRAIFDELLLLGEAVESDFVAGIVAQFVHDTKPLLIQLAAAVRADDGRAVGRIAHSIKGSGDQLGGRRLASSCSRLVKRAAAGTLSDGQADLHAVETDHQELCRTLSHRLTFAGREHSRGSDG